MYFIETDSENFNACSAVALSFRGEEAPGSASASDRAAGSVRATFFLISIIII